jgi:hypothetical protein
MEDKKKRAAAISAVMAYIKTQEEAVAMQPVPVLNQAGASNQVHANLWGVSGRQSQMQIRNLIQMKAFCRR